jgi:hypothetical protein
MVGTILVTLVFAFFWYASVKQRPMQRKRAVDELRKAEIGTEAAVYCRVLRRGHGPWWNHQSEIIGRYVEAGWRVLDQSVGKSFMRAPYVNIRFKKLTPSQYAPKPAPGDYSPKWYGRVEKDQSQHPAGSATQLNQDF